MRRLTWHFRSFKSIEMIIWSFIWSRKDICVYHDNNKQTQGVNFIFSMLFSSLIRIKIKQNFRQACYINDWFHFNLLIKAGIAEEKLTLALEPEAASIYCQTYPPPGSLDIINTDCQYLVVDLGGKVTIIWEKEWGEIKQSPKICCFNF